MGYKLQNRIIKIPIFKSNLKGDNLDNMGDYKIYGVYNLFYFY